MAMECWGDIVIGLKDTLSVIDLKNEVAYWVTERMIITVRLRKHTAN